MSDKDARREELEAKKIAIKKDHELDGLMSEIESDLREDELKRIWQRYGSTFATIAVVFLIAVAGYEGWRAYNSRQHNQNAIAFDTAVQAAADSKFDDAKVQFDAVAQTSDKPYASFARLTDAGVRLQQNDVEGAIAKYDALAADTSADPLFRDMAVVLKVLNSLDRADAKTLEGEIAPLRENSAFKYSAIELSALLAAKQGDTARAATFAQTLIDDASAPQSMRGRAQELATMYKAGIVPAALPPAAAAPAQGSVTDLVAPAAEAEPAKPVPARPAAKP